MEMSIYPAAPSEAMVVETRYVSTLQLEAKISLTNPKVLEIRTQNEVDIYGLQFTLSDINNEVVKIQSATMGIDEDNYYINGAMSMSWHVEDGQTMNDQLQFEIEFAEALNQSHLNQLSIVSAVTKAEAYMHSTFDIWDIALTVESAVELEVPSLSQNWPNPFSKSTLIEFYLPESTDNLTMSIFNAAGQLVWTQSQSYGIGTHQIEINANTLGASGVYHYKIKTETYSETKQMMVMD